jgi:hypothetical protein
MNNWEVLMKGKKCFAFAVAAAALCASPATAQEYGSPTTTTARNAGFIGAQARLSFGSAKATRPVARLTAGMTNLSLDQQGRLVSRSIGSTFELGLSNQGRPNFYIGGHRYSDFKRKLGIAPVGVALLAVGGLAVVGAAVAASSDSEKKPEVVCLGIGVCPTLPPGG